MYSSSTSRQRLLRRLVIAAVIAASAALVPLSALAHPAGHSRAGVVGAVYTETNDTSANMLVVFNRMSNGLLARGQTLSTGGKGAQQPQPGCPEPTCPILVAVTEVILTKDGNHVFAVNAGSNTIASFVRTHGRLRRAAVVSSHGVFPNSLTYHGNELYVLNQDSGTIAGFRFSKNGHLTLIGGSVKQLTTPGPSAVARQIGFDNTGKVLVVTLLNPMKPGQFDTFKVNGKGQPSAAKAYPSQNALPFGFQFDSHNILVNSEPASMMGTGFTATYRVSSSGVVTPLDNKSSNGIAPCWVAVTRNGHVYTINTPPSSIARYSISGAGNLRMLGLTQADTTNVFGRTDAWLSRDDRYLYVLASSKGNGNNGHVDEFRVGANGDLHLLGTTPHNLPEGASGLAAW